MPEALAEASFTCPKCGRTTHNPHDAEHRYCAACSIFMSNYSYLMLYGMRPDELDLARRLGFCFLRSLGDGRFLAVERQLFESAYLKLCTNMTAADDMWQYEQTAEAIVAAATWDPSTSAEPFGWYRHPFTSRRRTNGDPAHEYLHP